MIKYLESRKEFPFKPGDELPNGEALPKDYKPIDMSNFPYEAEDVIGNKIKVIEVQKGDKKDSGIGYLYQEYGVDKKGMKSLNGNIFYTSQPVYVTDVEVKQIDVVPNPYCQRVVYKNLQENKVYIVRPNEFLKIVDSLGDKRKKSFKIKTGMKPVVAK